MNTKFLTLLVAAVAMTAAVSCEEERGANPFDGTEYTVSQWPLIESFYPTSAKAGEEVTITGKNFLSVSGVSFGNTPAESLNIVSETEVKAVVAEGSHSGAVAVTNHKGTKSLKGFVFIAPPSGPGANLALGATATASSEFTPASNAVLGNDEFYWAPMGPVPSGTPEWILIELPEVSDVNEVVVKWYHKNGFDNNDPKSFDVQVSADGTTFTTVAAASTSATYFHETNPDGYDYTASFSKMAGVKYVRILINESQWQPMLAEVEVYCREAAVSSNVALGSTATASSEFAPASNTVLGDEEFYWAPMGAVPAGSPEWILLELPQASDLDRIVVKWYHKGGFDNNDPRSYEVQVSTDGTTFETVGTVSTSFTYLHETHCDGYNHTVDFAKRSGITHVKILINESQWQPMLAEVEAYCSAAAAASNLAPGSTSTASSEFAPASNAVLGDEEFYWAPMGAVPAGSPEWILLELPQASELSRVVVKWYHKGGFDNNDPRSYEVQVSTDGTTYETVGTVSTASTYLHETQCDGYVQYVGFQKRTGVQYVKVLINESQWQPMLAEVEAYNL